MTAPLDSRFDGPAIAMVATRGWQVRVPPSGGPTETVTSEQAEMISADSRVTHCRTSGAPRGRRVPDGSVPSYFARQGSVLQLKGTEAAFSTGPYRLSR
jgi:hypothetical protein